MVDQVRHLSENRRQQQMVNSNNCLLLSIATGETIRQLIYLLPYGTLRKTGMYSFLFGRVVMLLFYKL